MPPDPPEDEPPNPWGKARDAAEEAVESVAAATAKRTIVASESDSAPAAEQFNCPNCGGSIEIKAAGYSVSIICQYCASTLDITEPDVKLIQRWEEEVRKLELPIGSRGTLRGIEWDVIGYLRRSENGSYPWDEYLLFNPYHGYRFLDTDGRGWTLGRQLTAAPDHQSSLGLSVDGEFYTPFYDQTRAQVDYVLGEFYWRVAIGEESITADYVRPGKMLSWERDGNEATWMLGELLEPHEISDAFGIAPPKGGGLPLPHQPSPHRKKAGQMLKLALASIAFLFLVWFSFGGTSDRQTAVINLATNGMEQSAKIGPVVLDRARQAVTISARAPGIENSWIDLGYTLTNRENGDVYEASNVVERYNGRDHEGSWSEGSRSTSSEFSMVPAGTYDLEVFAEGSQWYNAGYNSSGNAQVEVSIAKGASFFGNFFLALLLVLVPALWQWIKHLGFSASGASL
jgi:hypothetical protein